MKIGIDARPLISKHPSGIGTYLINILNYLNVVDRENQYFLYSNKPLEYPITLGDNFTIRVINGKIGTLWLRYSLPQYIKADGIQVFWGTQHFLPKRVENVRMILTIHDVALLINPRWGSAVNSVMQNLFLKSSARDADKIIVVSKSTGDDTIKLCGIAPEKISVIYEGCPSPVTQQLSDEDATAFKEKFNIKERFFLFVGNIEPRKNIDTIIKAFELAAAKDERIQLVLAGGLGWKYEGILDQIKKSAFSDRIIRTGYISSEQKNWLFGNAIAFLFPSHYEGFGLPILEAYRAGTPVITAKKSSLPEVGGDAAWYVQDENSADELANVMDVLLSLPAEQKLMMTEKGRARCDMFSWKHCAEQTHRLLVRKD